MSIKQNLLFSHLTITPPRSNTEKEGATSTDYNGEDRNSRDILRTIAKGSGLGREGAASVWSWVVNVVMMPQDNMVDRTGRILWSEA